jgi:type II secretory pathway pseudopilin PulG
LIELLVTIAVIAIIAAIAVPNILNITASADRATKVRNAQLVASTYNSYLTFLRSTTPDALPYADAETAVAAIITSTGLSVTNSRLSTTNFFRAPVSSTNEIAMEKIAMEDGLLVYEP